MKYQKKFVSIFVIALVIFSFPLLAFSADFVNFVTVDNTTVRFQIDGVDFYFVGSNNYWLMQYTSYGGDYKACVDEAFDSAQAAGVKVIRTWGFADGYSWTNPDDPAIMQKTSGEYMQPAFEAMDYVIAQAKAHEIRLIIALVNNWDDYGGMNEYVGWAGGGDHDDFYTTEAIKQWYKNYLTYFVTRVNTITGTAYKDEPTIMAWELANEAQLRARKPDTSGLSLAAWYHEMSAHLKSVDPNHLVGTGEEGFAIEEYLDAGYYYSGYENTYVLRGSRGSGFLLNTALENIDFGSAHLYPSFWRISDIPSANHWIRDHTVLARDLPTIFEEIRGDIPPGYEDIFPEIDKVRSKPVILGEFGNTDRSVYASWLDTVYNEGTGGALLWELNPDCRHTEKFGIQPQDGALYDTYVSLIGRMAAHTEILTDMVEITKINYNSRKKKLIVEATSTRGGTAFLEATYDFGTGPVTDIMFYDHRKDNYKLTATNVTADPGSVTVTSSFGGVDPPPAE